MTYCGNCGSDNPEGNRFCFNCGAELPLQPQQSNMGYIPTMDTEIERIRPYDPNANYYVPPQPPQQNYQQQQPYQQQYMPQQQYPPQQGYQQYPPAVYPGQQQQQYPPQGYQGYPQYPPQQYPGQRQREPPFYLYGAPNNQISFRWIAIILSIATLVMTILTLTIIPVTENDSLIGIGLGEDGLYVLIFCIMTIVIGILSLLVPLFNIVTGVCVIGTITLIFTNSGFAVTDTTLILFILMGVVIMVLGLVSSLLMTKYVRSNVRNVTMFECSLWTWIGIKMPQDQYQQQYQQYQY